MQQIFPAVWLSLAKEVKARLIEVFGVERTGVTEVLNQEVKSDGYTVEDLKAITLEKMCKYVGSEETFIRAWELTLAKVHSELHPPVGEIRSAEPVKEEVKPFCDSCESTGPKHFRTCPNYTPDEN